jgi:hypothetical protein
LPDAQRSAAVLRKFPPARIVCLTEETVETLYLLGEQDRIVGVSGYAVRPPRVRREKPPVSAFPSADIAKILAPRARPRLQAELAAELIRAGIAVHAFNQRDIVGICDNPSARNGKRTRAEYSSSALHQKAELPGAEEQAHLAPEAEALGRHQFAVGSLPTKCKNT